MKIGVYPGTFDPVHKGHIKLVSKIINQKIVDKVFIVPTKEYWNKTKVTNIKHRVNMLNEIEINNAYVNTKYSNIKSTYAILRRIEKDNPTEQIYLIIGADNLVKINKWINYEKLLKYPFIIAERGIYNKSYIEETMNKYKKTNYYLIKLKYNASSSLIRKQDKKGKYLNKKTMEYIKNNKLY